VNLPDIRNEEDLFALLLVLDDEDEPDELVEDVKQNIIEMKQRLSQMVKSNYY